MKNYPNWTSTCKTNLKHAELYKVSFAIKRGILENLQEISQGRRTGYATFKFEGNSYEMLTDESAVVELNRLNADGSLAASCHSDKTYLEFVEWYKDRTDDEFLKLYQR